MYANHRRGATASVKEVPTRQENEDAHSSERKGLVNELSPLDLVALHQDFVTAKNETEADTYLVLKCEPDVFQGRASSETDTAPRLIAKSLISLKDFQGGFVVPVHVVGSPNWRFFVPSFSDWLLSRCRYAEWDLAQGKLVPHKLYNGAHIKEMHLNDMLEVYYGALCGTLGEFYKTGDKETAKHVYRLVHTVRQIMTDLRGEQVTYEAFITAVKERDETIQKALVFKTMMSKTHPTCIATHLLRAMQENPEIVHKSRFMNLDYIFMAWMTLAHDQNPFFISGNRETAAVNSANENATAVAKGAHAVNDAKDFKTSANGSSGGSNVTASSAGQPVLEKDSEKQNAKAPQAMDIMDHVLRAILERTMKDVCYKNVTQFVDKEKLVQFIQESVGHNVEKRLTYWAFFLSALRELLLGPICSSRSFVERLTGLRSTISGFRGGLAGTCLLIAPRSTMQDQDLAEVILMTADASADEKKFATLRFPVSGQTLKLDSILTENVQRIQTKQAEAKKIADDIAKDAAISATGTTATVSSAGAAAVSGSATAAAPAAEAKKVVLDPKRKWNEFYEKSFTHAGDIPTLHRYIALVRAIAQQGTDVELLEETIAAGADKRILGMYRSIQLVLQSYPPKDSPVEKRYANVKLTGSKKRDSIQTVLYDLGHKLSSQHKLQQKEDTKKVEDDIPALFVKFVVARELTNEAKLAIKALAGQDSFECAICLSISKSLPEVLHGDTRHVVCRKCITTIGNECPYCREPLKKKGAAAATAAPVAASGKKN